MKIFPYTKSLKKDDDLSWAPRMAHTLLFGKEKSQYPVKEKVKNPNKYLEISLVVTIAISVGILNFWVPLKLAFLNFYYIPVLLTSYYLGRKSTLYGTFLCIFWVIFLACSSPQSFFFEPVWINIALHIATWACFLLLVGMIISKAHDTNRNHQRQQTFLSEKLSTHLAVSEELNSELDFDTLFHLIIYKLGQTMKAERTSLYIIDKKKNEVWTKAAEQIENIRLPIGKGVCGKVAQTGEIINAKDAWELPYFSREFDIKNNFRTRSMLCMPINNRDGKRIGVIQFINKKDEEEFSGDDVNLLHGLVSQVAVALENSLLVDELATSFESSIRTLSATVDARHPLTAGHSLRVTEYALMIAREMELTKNEQEAVKYAGLLHDIGKIGIPDSVLLKNGRFNSEERMEMNLHPLKTQEILEKFHFPKHIKNVPTIAACHHERIDGKGYPQGLTGDRIPSASKILAVVDVFDALTSKRDYPKYSGEKTMTKEPMPLSKVLDILANDTGSHFEGDVVTVFLKIMPQVLEPYVGTHFSREYVKEIVG